MPRPLIGDRPLTPTERQRRWREGKRLAQAAPAPEAEARQEGRPDCHPPRTGHGQYGHIVRATLAAVDALPQPHVALLDVIPEADARVR
jgi:hypothetical protein